MMLDRYFIHGNVAKWFSMIKPNVPKPFETKRLYCQPGMSSQLTTGGHIRDQL